ncbi:MAG: response regulator [Candidatus Sedimenticola sp. (ex Thyasira tokunagai)]
MTRSVARLLIVEDNSSLRQMLSWDFEERGYLVTAVSSCIEAEAALKERLFDLALLDYDLPDGSGTELLARLQQQLPGLPVILCSGRVTESEVGLGGAFAFVIKPIDRTTLHRLFQQALNDS